MLSLHAFTTDEIRQYQSEQHAQQLSYTGIGTTQDEQNIPAGYRVDRFQANLGIGRVVFQAARTALLQWHMFPAEMAHVYWPIAPFETGREVVIGFQVGPLHSLSPCRIIYTMDDSANGSTDGVDGRQWARFGFGYGTLPGHVAKGEERFMVAWDRSTDEVIYEIFCFSAPQHWLTKVGYPYLRYQQAKFRRLSAAAMQDAVNAMLDG